MAMCANTSEIQIEMPDNISCWYPWSHIVINEIGIDKKAFKDYNLKWFIVYVEYFIVTNDM